LERQPVPFFRRPAHRATRTVLRRGQPFLRRTTRSGRRSSHASWARQTAPRRSESNSHPPKPVVCSGHPFSRRTNRSPGRPPVPRPGHPFPGRAPRSPARPPVPRRPLPFPRRAPHWSAPPAAARPRKQAGCGAQERAPPAANAPPAGERAPPPRNGRPRRGTGAARREPGLPPASRLPAGAPSISPGKSAASQQNASTSRYFPKMSLYRDSRPASRLGRCLRDRARRMTLRRLSASHWQGGAVA
jgi:hypothetical protein